MKRNKVFALLLAALMLFTLCSCISVDISTPEETQEQEQEQESAVPAEEAEEAAAAEITITDMIGREVTVTPGSYTRVVCIGAGALRMYSYIGDVSLLCGG